LIAELLLILVSKTILGSKSLGIHDHTLLFYDSGSLQTSAREELMKPVSFTCFEKGKFIPVFD
jgi:hypothetical protein